ncbi:MAG TPA: Mpo1-like protein, partial [Thermoanaerobaculia bacterium]|nr:Mpo1-like protein [Thermoanaerobaculia bacterium]
MSQSDPTFSEFYADYLAHHRHPWNRALHLAAKLLALAGFAGAVYERSVLLLLAAPVLAVAPCWIGHLLFEGDRPVSWTQPAASLLGSLGRICGIGGIGG